ncbi:MAG: hypothetical protein AB7G28_04660 [Pirellulales bacterium]
MQQVVAFGYAAPAAGDPLANYQRTALGDWQMASHVDRNDPWIRLVLLAARPVVIDVAIFIDGKPYTDGREAWIDDVLKPPATAAKAAEKQIAAQATDRDSKATTKGKVDTAEKADTKEKKTIAAAATDDTKVAAESRKAPSMRERVNDYVSSAGAAVDRSEIRWLIAEWGFGPPVVLLDQSFSWQRAEVAPLLVCLDTDRSGALEAAEIAAAPEALQRADANADDVVDMNELERKATKPPVLPFAADHPLLVMIDDATDRGALAATCARLYGIDSLRVDELLEGRAEAIFRVELGSDAAEEDAVRIFADSYRVKASDDSITYDLGAEYVEFSAAFPAASKSDSADSAATQIALGAVVDGNPLERLLDTDHDQRLTQRERQQLPKLLASLDRNGDGQVAAAELPIPIRLAVTAGPNVHRLLAKPAGVARSFAQAAAPSSTPQSPTAPDWFVSMDSNADGDLSRAEFLGTPDQFGQFDADGDGLLSVGEAEKMAPGN